MRAARVEEPPAGRSGDGSRGEAGPVGPTGRLTPSLDVSFVDRVSETGLLSKCHLLILIFRNLKISEVDKRSSALRRTHQTGHSKASQHREHEALRRPRGAGGWGPVRPCGQDSTVQGEGAGRRARSSWRGAGWPSPGQGGAGGVSLVVVSPWGAQEVPGTARCVVCVTSRGGQATPAVVSAWISDTARCGEYGQGRVSRRGQLV